MVVPLIPHSASSAARGSGSILPLLSSARPVSCAAMRAETWWREGVLYQIYPRSFADSDGDGIGDLRGIVGRLDHLEWLGVDGIWLNPTMPSPNDDWGYDVSDYCGVHPELGTLADLDALVAAADERGMRVLLDLVPNHTSDRHAWFVDALSGRDARYRDYYVWADPGPDGGPPNNWRSNFGGSAWQLHEPTGQYFLNNFLPSQPDLNWWNDDVRDAFDDILRFWFSRAIADGQDPRRVLVGETYVLDLDSLIPYYGRGEDELHLAFNFLFVHSELDAADLRTVVEGIEQRLPELAWPVYTGSNHDAGRLATRWAAGDERRTRTALMMLLTLRGTPFLYYGDEIGLPEVPIDPQAALDPVARRTGDESRNRDVCRTPMPWSDEPGGGFTTAEADPWLPFGDLSACNVAAQRGDRGSVLHLVRDLIALRGHHADLRTGSYESLPAPDGAWAWRRGAGFVVALNLSDAEVVVEDVAGTVAIATDRARDGDAVDGVVRLAPYEAVVVRLGR